MQKSRKDKRKEKVKKGEQQKSRIVENQKTRKGEQNKYKMQIHRKLEKRKNVRRVQRDSS